MHSLIIPPEHFILCKRALTFVSQIILRANRIIFSIASISCYLPRLGPTYKRHKWKFMRLLSMKSITNGLYLSFLPTMHETRISDLPHWWYFLNPVMESVECAWVYFFLFSLLVPELLPNQISWPIVSCLLVALTARAFGRNVGSRNVGPEPVTRKNWVSLLLCSFPYVLTWLQGGFSMPAVSVLK